MKRIALIIFALAILNQTQTYAQSTTPYQLTWLTTNAATSTGNTYTLSAQVSSQGESTAGGTYTLSPLSPPASVQTQPRAYLPLVQR